MLGAVDGVGVSFWMWLHVHAAMGSFAVVLLVAVLGVGLVNNFSPSEMVLSSEAPSVNAEVFEFLDGPWWPATLLVWVH